MHLLSSADFFKIYFLKKFFLEHYQSVKWFGHNVYPDLGPNLFKGYQQTTKDAIARKELKNSIQSLFKVTYFTNPNICIIA